MERLFGAAFTVLFCVLSQILLSLPALRQISGPVYLGVQVLVTLLCFLRFDGGAFQADPPAGRKEPQVAGGALYFFFAHRAVVFFFSYLPHTPHSPLVGLAGTALLIICLYAFFAFRFNTWFLCSFFFIGMLSSAVLQLLFQSSGSLLLTDVLQGFGYMGYIASYYLLGSVLHRHVGYGSSGSSSSSSSTALCCCVAPGSSGNRRRAPCCGRLAHADPVRHFRGARAGFLSTCSPEEKRSLKPPDG